MDNSNNTNLPPLYPPPSSSNNDSRDESQTFQSQLLFYAGIFIGAAFLGFIGIALNYIRKKLRLVQRQQIEWIDRVDGLQSPPDQTIQEQQGHEFEIDTESDNYVELAQIPQIPTQEPPPSDNLTSEHAPQILSDAQSESSQISSENIAKIA